VSEQVFDINAYNKLLDLILASLTTDCVVPMKFQLLLGIQGAESKSASRAEATI
jgi:hypothetical protein